LTVAVLVFFILVLTLTALFRLLLLTSLVTLLGIVSLLSVLTGLTTLLALLFHIVCHEYSSKISATTSRLENLSTNCQLVAAIAGRVGRIYCIIEIDQRKKNGLPSPRDSRRSAGRPIAWYTECLSVPNDHITTDHITTTSATRIPG
jgi:hypothetical protein